MTKQATADDNVGPGQNQDLQAGIALIMQYFTLYATRPVLFPFLYVQYTTPRMCKVLCCPSIVEAAALRTPIKNSLSTRLSPSATIESK